jgi:hypothetical protein
MIDSFTTRYLVEHDSYPDGLYVLVEESPPEPDVGIFGNGKTSISVEQVFKGDGYGSPTDEEITGDLSPDELDSIAHKIYAQIGDKYG